MALPATILRRYREEVETVLALDYETFWALVSALGDMPRSLIPEKLAPELASEVGSVPQTDLEEILRMLFSLCTLRDRFGLSTPEVAEDVSGVLEAASDEDRERVKDRLTELLDLDRVNVIAKAGILQINHERWMQTAQILTDIRPVFGDPKESPTAAVIVHTLKLSYFGGNEIEELFVAMDSNDLHDLSQQIDRASSKAASLRSVLDASKVHFVDDERETGGEEDDSG